MPTLVIGWVARLLSRLTEARLAPLGITAAQLPVLVALKDGEKRTQKDLANIAGVEQPSMAQLLGRMERDGLIRREPSPDNWRSSLVMLSDHAEALLEPGRDALRALDETICDGLSAEERSTLLRLLFQIAAGAEKIET
jgi:DNA-binding MarR family transcriptional regulator